jgi:hypothetical protein
MNSPGLARRAAGILVRHAQRLLPARRADWGRAMAVEMEHVESDLAALRWSIGCALASYQEAIRMTRSNLEIARWLLGLEVLACLGPLTLGWFIATYGVFTAPADARIMFMPLVFWALGPVGLLLALFAIALRRPVPATRFAVLAVSFGLLAVLPIMRVAGPSWFYFDFAWRDWMLTSVLPAIVCAHLALLRPATGASRPLMAS